MKTLKIVGKNYCGYYTKTRIACRAIVVEDGKMLLSYETKNDFWMIPGGGLEVGESGADCCIREVVEETGVLIEPSECLLEIVEYYENVKWVNRYFLGKSVGEGERQLTARETAVGMEPRWIPLEEIRDIFSRHESYAATDEMRRGLYFREYTALNELCFPD